MFSQDELKAESIVKEEPTGGEEFAVAVAEFTTLKQEIKEEYIDTPDPLSLEEYCGKYFHCQNWFLIKFCLVLNKYNSVQILQ